VAKQRPRHPNKEIEKALAYAEKQGWQVVPLSGHAWGKILCPWNDIDCRCGTFCQTSVWSTPRVPEHMAHNIHRVVDGCARRMAAETAKSRSSIAKPGSSITKPITSYDRRR